MFFILTRYTRLFYCENVVNCFRKIAAYTLLANAVILSFRLSKLSSIRITQNRWCKIVLQFLFYFGFLFFFFSNTKCLSRLYGANLHQSLRLRRTYIIYKSRSHLFIGHISVIFLFFFYNRSQYHFYCSRSGSHKARKSTTHLIYYTRISLAYAGI